MEPHSGAPALALPPLIPRSHTPEPAGAASLAAARVVPALREAIVNGTLMAGSRLSEAQIAAHYGVSRTPVRQAFAALEREGLLTTVARTGVYVRGFDARDTHEVFELREALESQACRAVARGLTRVGRARLEERLAALEAAPHAGDLAAFAAALDGFYGLLLELSGNATMRRVYQSFDGPVRRLRRIGLHFANRPAATYQHAVAIVAAIVAGDEDAAERAMREQLISGRNATLAVLAREEKDDRWNS